MLEFGGKKTAELGLFSSATFLVSVNTAQTMRDAFAQIGASFSFAPFSRILQPLIDETLVELDKDQHRKGTILTPRLLVWLVLALTLRRDLNAHKVLNWMVSGFRWLRLCLPARSLIVKDGTVSHARVRLGVEVFRVLFHKLIAAFRPIAPDFHGLVSVAFDGTTGTMPDTADNVEKFHQPSSRSGKAAFPQMRMVTLMALTHKVEDRHAPPTKSGRKRWNKVRLIVRVIRIEMPGFRPITLITNILDETITARELALHYHKRWDIEIAYDEIKTHQGATLRGQSPTTFRSKRPDLVEQELYAMLIMYNLIRLLIRQAAEETVKDPCSLSFLDALQHIIPSPSPSLRGRGTPCSSCLAITIRPKSRPAFARRLFCSYPHLTLRV